MTNADKRQRQKQGRQARLEAAKKEAERRRRRNLNIFLAVIVVAVLGFFLLNRMTSKSKKVTTTNPKPTPTFTHTPTSTASAAVSATASACSTTKPPRGATVSQTTAPPMTISASKTYTATIVTSCGTVVVALDPKTSPNTVNSFVYLANKGFYNGLTFHRVAKDFAVQGGDPSGNGSGGPGYSVVDTPPTTLKYVTGTVAMAKTGAEAPGTSGSQFFIVPAGGATSLPADYALLGHVTSGMDAVTKLNSFAPSSGDGAPTQPLYIDTITITAT